MKGAVGQAGWRPINTAIFAMGGLEAAGIVACGDGASEIAV